MNNELPANSENGTPENNALRLEILSDLKQRFTRRGDVNESPFEHNRIIGYQTDVDPLDVPEIHETARNKILTLLKGVRAENHSEIVLLAGDPGAGKTHLINALRSPARQQELEYVLLCGSQHWHIDQFEQYLLDLLIAALIYPAPDQPNLLNEKIEDIAFLALQQILRQPGDINRFKKKKRAGGLFSRLFQSNVHQRFEDAIKSRDKGIFEQLDFKLFSDYVCLNYLSEPNHPFDRSVMKVLLRLLYSGDHDRAIAWLRGKRIESGFRKVFDYEETVERPDQFIKVIQILISLFYPSVSEKLSSEERTSKSRTFLFVFDQMEARAVLFDTQEEWRKFFGQLCEFYNALPNIFLLFTMTRALFDQHSDNLEGQFRQRFRTDPELYLEPLSNNEVKRLYVKRLQYWLGEEASAVMEKYKRLENPVFPLKEETLVPLNLQRNSRLLLQEFDRRFREEMGKATVRVGLDFHAQVNELRRQAQDEGSKFIRNHTHTIQSLLRTMQVMFPDRLQISVSAMNEVFTEKHETALEVEFRDPTNPKSWLRINYLQLPYRNFEDRIEDAVSLLARKSISRNLLWLARYPSLDSNYKDKRSSQLFTQSLTIEEECRLQAIQHVWDKHQEYPTTEWEQGELEIWSELYNETDFGKMLQLAENTLLDLRDTPLEDAQTEDVE